MTAFADYTLTLFAYLKFITISVWYLLFYFTEENSHLITKICFINHKQYFQFETYTDPYMRSFTLSTISQHTRIHYEGTCPSYL